MSEKASKPERVTVCFVCDEEYDRNSASPDIARLMVRSVKLFQPKWKFRCGLIGKAPPWLEEEGVIPTKIKAPDSVLRFANKIAAIEACGGELEEKEDFLLFLDGDILMCRPLETPLSWVVMGVHTDYPNEGTTDRNGIAVYGACNVPFPTRKIPCTMYGKACWPTINTGVLFFHRSAAVKIAQRWLWCFNQVAISEKTNKTYAEQASIMPALDSLGFIYKLLPATYNWNATIYPGTADTIFLHYHRPDILPRDPVAKRIMARIQQQ